MCDLVGCGVKLLGFMSKEPKKNKTKQSMFNRFGESFHLQPFADLHLDLDKLQLNPNVKQQSGICLKAETSHKTNLTMNK